MFQNNSFHGNGILIEQNDTVRDFHNFLQRLSAIETVAAVIYRGYYITKLISNYILFKVSRK